MLNIVFRTLVAAVAAPVLCLSSPAVRAEDDAPPRCPVATPKCPDVVPPKSLLVLNPKAFAQPVAGDCSVVVSANMRVQRCQERDRAPPEPGLLCSEGGGVVACEAWPQGPELTYAWAVSGGLVDPVVADGRLPLLAVDCTPPYRTGRITVVITGPTGVSSSYSRLVGCATQ